MIRPPHIAIASWLGPEEVREERLKNHLRQRKVLAERFGDFRVLSVCSEYTKEEREQLKGFDSIHFPTKVTKDKKHNWILSNLYLHKNSSAVLVLDDDVVPITMEEFELDPFQVLHDWLVEPESMPAPCVYFSCKGLFADLYSKQRVDKSDLALAAMRVVGWATMVRNDLGTYLETKGVPLLLDTAFRVRCAANGKLVLKHQKLYFETFQKNEKRSVLVRDHEDRKKGIEDCEAALANLYPHLFYRLKNGKLQGIWQVRGDKRRRMVAAGALRETEYGCVPVPGVIEDYKEGLGLV